MLLTCKLTKQGVELPCSVSVSVPSQFASSVKTGVMSFNSGKRILVMIAANVDVNTNLTLAVKVENVTYKYTIPVKTIADGENGEKGETGATLRGPQSWPNCGNGYSFQAGAAGEEWKDVVIYNSGYYSCIKSHVKSATNYPGSDEDQNNGYWRLGSPIELVVAKIILAQYQLVENLGVRVIEMKDKDNNTVFLAKDGDVICKSGTFENINASGTFKSRNPTTWNEVEMNADEGSITMRGPSNVDDDNNQLPSTGATLIDLLKLDYEVDPDNLARIARVLLLGRDRRLSMNNEGVSLSDQYGITHYKTWENILK